LVIVNRCRLALAGCLAIVGVVVGEIVVGVAEAVAASTDETTTSTAFVAVLPKESVAMTTTLYRPVPV